MNAKGIADYARRTQSFSGPLSSKMEDFTATLKQAVDAQLPTNSKRYRNVRALLFMWEIDNLGSENEVKALEEIFLQMYFYDTRIRKIPASRSDAKAERFLFSELTEACAGMTENDLVIIYYAGHSVLVRDTEACIFQSGDVPIFPADFQARRGTQTHTYCSANFTDCKKATSDRACADVLYIIDASYASTASIKGNNELLAATSVGLLAQRPVKTSMTAYLLDVLRENRGEPISIAVVHARMMEDHLNRGIQEMQYTPVHATLSDEMARSGGVWLVSMKDFALPNRIPSTVRASADDLKVLISVQLSDVSSFFDIAKWTRCITENLPPHVKNIEIEVSGIFPASSATFIIMIPLVVWNVLPRIPGCRHVEMVRGGNKLLPPVTPPSKPAAN